jgi:hypothetical protein
MAVDVTRAFAAHDVEYFFADRVPPRQSDPARVDADRLRNVARAYRFRDWHSVPSRTLYYFELTAFDYRSPAC